MVDERFKDFKYRYLPEKKISNKQLFELRKQEVIFFENIEESLDLMTKLFWEGKTFPLVIGPYDPNYKDRYPEKDAPWKVKRLEPLRKTDLLTVENYLEAVRLLRFRKDYGEFWAGSAHYEGVQEPCFSDDCDDITIFSTSIGVGDREKEKGIQEFTLSIDFSRRDPLESLRHNRKSIGYTAESEMSRTPLERAFSRFVGPN